MSDQKVDLLIAVVGGAQGGFTAGDSISILSAAGQAIAGIVTAIAPIGGGIAVNPAAGLLTLVKIGIDADRRAELNLGDALSVVGNGVSLAAAFLMVVPGGQAVALPLALIGRAMALAGIGLSILDVRYPLDTQVNTSFNAARDLVQQRDPLVLDLDGDGLELSPASSNLLFDHNADGIKTGTGWAGADDGFLVRDLNGNGLIDSGHELFGVDTVRRNGQLATQGFDALSDLDSNSDGQITSADAAWSELQVWRDLNQDGITQAGELNTLTSLNITNINLNGNAAGPQAGQTVNNNRVALSTTFTQGGATRTVGAIDHESNPFFSRIPAEQVDETGNPVTLTGTAQALPQMNGSGMVRNLRAAMSQAGAAADELEAAVVAFAAATTRDAQLAQVDAVITEWAQTSVYWSDLETTLGGSVTLTPPKGISKAGYLIECLPSSSNSSIFNQAIRA
ncbi:hypothetical protein [Hydrogenophaga sp.]|uniref:hypothetical protein n=1 Tax=Hydrogenophaga sp. TaxID=1904254 RepID=UPI002715A3FC|nr:hypothetical protein [Hydrogenophaga sp.]MDO9434967.1 hypothetical protein [Hydrogenophaga sp.]